MSTPIGASQWMYSAGEFEIGQSVKFNDDDSQYLSWTPTSAGNRKTWTWAGWVKLGSVSTTEAFFSARSGNQQTLLQKNSSGQLQFYSENSGGTGLGNIKTDALFRDASAWYHIVFALDASNSTTADRLIIYVNGVRQDVSTTTSISNADHNISTTLQHTIGREATQSAYLDGYLADVYFIDGTALDATSFGETVDGYWKAKEASGLTFGSNGFHLNFKDDVVSEGFNTVTYTGTGAAQSISGLGLTPDLVWLKERTDADAHLWFDSVRGANKKIYSNLTNAEYITMSNELMSFDADGFSLGASGNVTTDGNKMVGWCWDAGANNAATGHSSVDFYATAGSAGKVRGLGFTPDLVWTKARNTTQSHQLFDSVRGDNNILYSNLTNAESAQSAGYFTLEPDGFNYGTSTFSSNTYIAWAWDAGTGDPASNTNGTINSTVKASSANGFSIITYTGNGTAGATIGHGLSSAPEFLAIHSRDTAQSWLTYDATNGGTKYMALQSTQASSANSDRFNDTDPTSSVITLGTHVACNTNAEDYVCYAWHSVSGYSDIGSYTGNGSSSGPTITTGFRPGFVLFKRTDTTGNWFIVDTTRNPFNTVDLRLYPNVTNADSATDSINVTNTGFEIVGTFSDINASGGTYIYMAFKGSYSDYVSDVNTDGSVDSRVKANTDYGFSIVTYTATGSGDITVGHGLGVTPSLIIGKTRNQAYDWRVFHTDLGGTKQLALNSNAAAATANAWGQTDPTSSVFTAGRGGNENLNYASGDTVVCYCFAEVSGYSKISSYTGNGSASGPTVTTGFRPAFVIAKRTDSAISWVVFDNTRDPSNPVFHRLNPDSSGAEGTNVDLCDFSDTGFTITTSDAVINASGGTYIYMAFADTREYAFWKDVSGNGNNWTPNALDYRDSMPDTPQNNFATINPAIGPHGCTVQEGNLYVTVPDNKSIGSTFAVDSGKWYVEFYADSSSYVSAGIVGDSQAFGANLNGSSVAYMYSYIGTVYKEGTGDTTPASFTSGDVIGLYADLDNDKLYIYKNGAGITTSEGTHVVGSVGISITDRNYYFGATSNGNNAQVIFNFGQDSTFSGVKALGSYTDNNGIGSFQHDPDSYLALCTSNLDTPTIVDGSDHFNTVLYTGTGATQSITGVGFQADFNWFKARSSAIGHLLYDSVRGATKYLQSASTSAEGTGSDSLTSFDSDGFSLGADTSTTGVNQSSTTYVAWNWKAGGTAVSNTDGTITSQVSAGEYMSICTWTGNGTSGATIGHGIGKVPSMIIVKRRNTANGWAVYHEALGTGSEVYLNLTQAKTNSNFWITSPTSSVFSVSASDYVNTSSDTFVGYAFADLEGACKVGSFSGNGTNQFVHTGFRPAFLLVKRSSNASGWYIFDSERGPYNPNKLNLSPNSSAAESTASGGIHFLSNGFEETGFINDSGQTVIYLAIAETPFKYANAR